MWICSRKLNQTALKTADFHQISRLGYIWWCVVRGNSLSWRHQPSSRCQQVSLMSPHPKALLPQRLSNKYPFKPVWGNAPETNKGPTNPFICCWKEPGEEAYSSNPTFLFHSELLFFPNLHAVPSQGLFLLNRRITRKRSLQSHTLCKLLRKWSCFFFFYLNQIYSSDEYFGGVSGAACLSVCVYLSLEVKIWWEVNSQKALHPSPGGRKQCIWSNLPEVSLRDLERWTPIYHH